MRIRRYQPADLAALYRICLETGDSGRDATGQYRDPKLLGHVYAGPYGVLEPEAAFVLEDRDSLDQDGFPEVVGYVLAAIDTLDFNRRVRSEWLPALWEHYPDPSGERSTLTPDERMMRLLHRPDMAFPLALPSELAGYPSHLHIDLLPVAQGRGHGRAMIEALLVVLRRRGSPGVHLGVGARNQRALAFYRHLGFERLQLEESDAIVMGMRLD